MGSLALRLRQRTPHLCRGVEEQTWEGGLLSTRRNAHCLCAQSGRVARQQPLFLPFIPLFIHSLTSLDREPVASPVLSEALVGLREENKNSVFTELRVKQEGQKTGGAMIVN